MTDEIGAAIHVTAPKPEGRKAGSLRLSSGRTVMFNLPILSSEDVIEVILNFPGIAKQVETQLGAGVILVPGGHVTVPKQ